MDKLVFISHSTEDKLIADAVCHRLEAEGIRCWIAPRDIGNTNWAGSIIEGLHRSNVFVVIISRNSISSGEVAKEVTEATRTCDYILPFKVDNEILSDLLRYHLAPCHWLDAVSPPLEKRISELIDRIRNLSEEDIVYLNDRRRRLKDKIVLPRGLFIGREREIKEIAQHLSQDHVLFLQGMGGIGKSEIAKGYAQKYRDSYDTIIFAGFSSNIMDLICSEEIGIENLSRAEGEEMESWYARKLETLQSLTDKRTLLIVDNFDADEDEHLEDLLNCACDILITTRNDHSDYPTMIIGQIDDFDAVRRIFTTHYGRKLSEEDIAVTDEILKLVGCHTITVELIAKQMKASFIKPAKMLERLRRTGVNMHLKEKVKREGSAARQTGYDYIRQLFSFAGLTDPQKHLLCCMCLVPAGGIEVTMLGEIMELEDYDDVNSLINGSWIMPDDNYDILRMHPIIADVVREELKPTAESCKDYIHGLYVKSIPMWNMIIEDKMKLFALIRRMTDLLPEPVEELVTEYGQFGDCAWICGDFQRSQRMAERLYSFSLQHFGERSREAGMAAMYAAAAYFNAGDDAASEPWYEKGCASYTAVLDPNDRLLGVCNTKLARCARLRKDFVTAQQYLDKCEKIFDYINEHHLFSKERRFSPSYGAYLMEIENLLTDKGLYAEAVEAGKRTYAVFNADREQEIANVPFVMRHIGEAYSLLGEYDEAQKWLQEAYELNTEYNGPRSLSTWSGLEAIADNERRRGDTKKACSIYTELEQDLGLNLGENNPNTVRVREKREILEGKEEST